MSADNVSQPSVAQTLSDHNVAPPTAEDRSVAPPPAEDPLANIMEYDISGTRYLIVFGAKDMVGGCTPPASSWTEAQEFLKRHPLYDNKAKGWFSLHYQVQWPKDTEVKVEDYFPVVEGARLIHCITKDYGPVRHPNTGKTLDWMAPLDYKAPGVLTYNKETTAWVWEKEALPVIEVSPEPKESYVCFEGAGRGVVAQPAKKKVKFSSPLTSEDQLVAGTLPSDLGQKSPGGITAFKLRTRVRTIDGTDRKGIVIGCAMKGKDETYLGIAFDDEPIDEDGNKKTEAYPISALEVDHFPRTPRGSKDKGELLELDPYEQPVLQKDAAARKPPVLTPPPSIYRSTSVCMRLDDETQLDDPDVDELEGDLKKLG